MDQRINKTSDSGWCQLFVTSSFESKGGGGE